jgi:excisionase family DNA binding protein
VTYLYRCYGDDGRLLYVGMTDNVERRLQSHRVDKSAWFEHLANITVEQHPDRISAEAAERNAIRSERPLYNVSGSGSAQSPIQIAAIVERIKAEVDDDLLYTPYDAAAKLNRSRTTIQILTSSGELRSMKIGRYRRIPGDALKEYAATLEAAALAVATCP